MVACEWVLVLPQCFFIITGRHSELLHKAYKRINNALRPRTASAYSEKFKLYIAFTSWCHIPLVKVDSILAFLELLAQSGSRSHTLASYVSVLKHFFRLYDLDITGICHRKVHLLVKSVSMNAKYFPKFKANFTIETLTRLVHACDQLTYGKVYKAAYLLAFFAFLRLSNVAPSSPSSFDVTRHLIRSDIIFGHPGAHVVLKWAKAMQSAQSHQIVQIPSLPGSPICPIAALRDLLQFVPASRNSPLFLIPKPSGLSILTAPMISSTLASLLRSLHLNPSSYGFHSFRRSAVSWAADHNVPLQNLQAHGGWASSAIFSYLKHTPKASSRVANTFQQVLTTH